MHSENQRLPDSPASDSLASPNPSHLWCACCHRVVDDPLVCRDCSGVICRSCGTPLESADELAFG